MNRFYYKGLFEKNRIYIYKAASQTYLKGKKKPLIRKVIGINFDMETSYLYPKKYSDDTMIQFASRERERHYRDTDQFENYHVALFKIRKKYYNKEEMSRLEKELLLITLSDFNELEILSKEDDIMEKAVKELRRVVKTVDFEDLGRKKGRASGLSQNEIQQL